MRDSIDKACGPRERLIDAAVRLAFLKGFRSTSVRAVMEEAKVGKGSFYHHFKSKNELGLAVLERERANFIAMVEQTLAQSSGLDALRNFFQVALKEHSQNNFEGGCLWGNTALEMSDSDPDFIAPVKSVFHDWAERIEEAIADGQGQGTVRGDIGSADLAALVVATIEGGIMLSRLQKDAAPMRSCLDSLLDLLASNE